MATVKGRTPAIMEDEKISPTVPEQATEAASASVATAAPSIFSLESVNVRYSGKLAVKDVSFDLPTNRITALIGASGCGKSTLLRCLNRMNDLIPGATVEGKVEYQGLDLYAPDVDPVQVRKHIGMVFQRPNPFPKSIYDNVAFGPRVLGMDKDRTRTLDEIVEKALTRASLWDEVKDRLNESAIGMSGGQQQRLCIARAIATSPNVILMDEPCSALDPISTGRVEDLMVELKERYTIVVVTHNMQQAARVSDMTAYFSVEVAEDDKRHGKLVEYDETETIFTNPNDQRTEDYVTGKVG
jgi:phosphate transport system ATP-binding protein